jgi:predicted nucleic acid-binding Zn ribbon protein
MPTYTFRKKDTGEVYDVHVSMSEREEILKDDNIEQIISSPKIVRDVGSMIKTSDAFKETIAKIKETYKINNIPNY